MGKFIFLHLIIILSFLVTDTFSDSSDCSKDRMNELFDLEQLSSSDSESATFHPYSEQYGIMAKAGLKSSTNRRVSWHKTSCLKSINREIIIQSKIFSFLERLSFKRENYIHVLTSRHINGFYIYSLKKLIV